MCKYLVDAVQVLIKEPYQFCKQPDPSMKDRAIYDYTGNKQINFRLAKIYLFISCKRVAASQSLFKPA